MCSHTQSHKLPYLPHPLASVTQSASAQPKSVSSSSKPPAPDSKPSPSLSKLVGSQQQQPPSQSDLPSNGAPTTTCFAPNSAGSSSTSVAFAPTTYHRPSNTRPNAERTRGTAAATAPVTTATADTVVDCGTERVGNWAADLVLQMLEASKAGDINLVHGLIAEHQRLVAGGAAADGGVDAVSPPPSMMDTADLINCRDIDGRHSTPLHFAAGYNRLALVELLLKFGADVHAVDKGGLVPLHNACSYGHAKVGLGGHLVAFMRILLILLDNDVL